MTIAKRLAVFRARLLGAEAVAKQARWPAGAAKAKGGQFAPDKAGGGAGGATSGAGKQGSLFPGEKPMAPPPDWAKLAQLKATTNPTPAPSSASKWWGGPPTAAELKNPFKGEGGKPPGFHAPQYGMPGKAAYEPAKPPPGAKPHAKTNDKGEPVMVNYPTKASDAATWRDPTKTATFVPGGDVPGTLQGVKMAPWTDHPTTTAGWASVEGQNAAVERSLPPMKNVAGKHVAAGVIIEEPDGRVWLCRPTNSYGGYDNTFPKGSAEDGHGLQATAIKEAFEETGLKIQITGVLGDYERSTSVARMFTAKRVGGTVKDMGWESQAMRLAPRSAVGKLLNTKLDRDIIDDHYFEADIGKAAGPRAPLPTAAFDFTDVIRAAITKAKGGVPSKGGAWEKQPRWPAGPNGGQWKTYDSDGVLLPPKLGSAQNPVYEKKGAALYGLAKAGEVGALKTQAEALAAKVASVPAGKTLNFHDKQFAKLSEYATALAGLQATAPKAEAQAFIVTGTVETLTAYKKTGSKPGGNNPGGMYQDAAGQAWLAKGNAKYTEGAVNGAQSDDRAHNEVLAAKLMQAVGIGAPDMKLADFAGAHGTNPGKLNGGNLGVLSKWVPGGVSFDYNNDAHLAAAQADFAVHAWLANYDAIGLSYDNTRIVGGKAVCIDPGGALLFRAKGLPKYKDGKLPTTVGELSTMRDPKVNGPAGAVYGGMTQAQLKASAEKLTAIDDATIKALVKAHGPGDDKAKAELAATLIARRDYVLGALGAAPAMSKTPVVPVAAVPADGPAVVMVGMDLAQKPDMTAATVMQDGKVVGTTTYLGQLEKPVFDKKNALTDFKAKQLNSIAMYMESAATVKDAEGWLAAVAQERLTTNSATVKAALDQLEAYGKARLAAVQAKDPSYVPGLGKEPGDYVKNGNVYTLQTAQGAQSFMDPGIGKTDLGAPIDYPTAGIPKAVSDEKPVLLPGTPLAALVGEAEKAYLAGNLQGLNAATTALFNMGTQSPGEKGYLGTGLSAGNHGANYAAAMLEALTNAKVGAKLDAAVAAGGAVKPVHVASGTMDGLTSISADGMNKRAAKMEQFAKDGDDIGLAVAIKNSQGLLATLKAEEASLGADAYLSTKIAAHEKNIAYGRALLSSLNGGATAPATAASLDGVAMPFHSPQGNGPSALNANNVKHLDENAFKMAAAAAAGDTARLGALITSASQTAGDPQAKPLMAEGHAKNAAYGQALWAAMAGASAAPAAPTAPVNPFSNGAFAGPTVSNMASKIEAAINAKDVPALQVAEAMLGAAVKDNSFTSGPFVTAHEYAKAGLAHLGASSAVAGAGTAAPVALPSFPTLVSTKYYDGLAVKAKAAYEAGDLAALQALATKKGGPAWPVKTHNGQVMQAFHDKLVADLTAKQGAASTANSDALDAAVGVKVSTMPREAKAAVMAGVSASPPMALPAVPKVSSPANPNAGLVSKLSAIEELAKGYQAGEVSKDAALQAIGSYSFGSNTYGKAGAKYQAGVIAAISGATGPAGVVVAPAAAKAASKPPAAPKQPAKADFAAMGLGSGIASVLSSMALEMTSAHGNNNTAELAKLIADHETDLAGLDAGAVSMKAGHSALIAYGKALQANLGGGVAAPVKPNHAANASLLPGDKADLVGAADYFASLAAQKDATGLQEALDSYEANTDRQVAGNAYPGVKANIAYGNALIASMKAPAAPAGGGSYKLKESDLPPIAPYKSSKPWKVQDNLDIQVVMHNFATVGDLAGLAAMTFVEKLDDSTGTPTGKTPSIKNHPSKEVVAFHGYVQQLMHEKKFPPKPLQVFSVTKASTLAAVSKAFPPAPLKTNANSLPSNQKFGYWAALGQVENPASYTPPIAGNLNSTQVQAGKAAYKKYSALTKKFIKNIQDKGGDYSMNGAYREGKETFDGDNLKEMAKAVLKDATELPEGSTLHRWQHMTPAMVQSIKGAKPGLILDSLGPMCASYESEATKGFGPNNIKIIAAKGAKGVHSHGSGRFPGEYEVSIIPGSRFVFLGYKTKSNGHLEVQLLMLPPSDTLD